MGRKFLLADDHRIVRADVKVLLEDTYVGAEVSEAYDGPSVMKKLQEDVYDLIILDIQMPDADTPEIIRHIKQEMPDTPVLIFSMNSERLYALRMIKAGAKGFISKDAPLEELKKAIEAVLAKKRYISEDMAELLGRQSAHLKADNPFDTLSSRELEIVNMLLEGKSMTEISKTLDIKMSTASTHKARIFEKLNITNFFELKELEMIYRGE